MKLFSVFLSLIIVLVLTGLLSYWMGPEVEGLQWSAFDPLLAVEGILFTCTFGLGLPVWAALFLVMVLFLGLWYGLYCLLCRLMAFAAPEDGE